MGMYSDFALDSLEQDEFKRKKKRKNPFDIDSELNIDDLDISERQRNALKKLDMANQLTIIRALREGQELKNSNYGTQYAKNDRSSVVDGGLGSLSAKYESNNNPRAKDMIKMEDIAMVVIKLKRDTGPCLTTLNI